MKDADHSAAWVTFKLYHSFCWKTYDAAASRWLIIEQVLEPIVQVLEPIEQVLEPIEKVLELTSLFKNFIAS